MFKRFFSIFFFFEFSTMVLKLKRKDINSYVQRFRLLIFYHGDLSSALFFVYNEINEYRNYDLVHTIQIPHY
jgi:hypothetical protein